MKSLVNAISEKKMQLCGLFIVGLICTAHSKPTTDNQDNDYAVQNDDDYQYDDENVSPHSRIPVDVLISTVPPVLAVKEYTRHVRTGEDAVLECPVKNLSINNVVMWRNESTLLAQSKRVTNSRVSVDDVYTLTIHKVNDSDSGTYTCQILPQKLEVHAKLVVNDEPQNEKQDATTVPTTPPSSAHRESSTIFAFLLPTVLTVLLSANLVQRI